MTLRVARAAIITDDDYVQHSLPPPKRHHHLIALCATTLKYRTPVRCRQGFELSDGSFVDRATAWDVAVAAGQLLPRAPTGTAGTLFSEDVW